MKTYIFALLRYGIRLYFILFLGLIIISCEDFFISDATYVDVPGSEPQLVVNSYISPQDTLIRVFVGRSIPFTQKSSSGYAPIYGNADVYMARKGEAFIKFEYLSLYDCFVLNAALLKIEANNSYVLKVETHDGLYAEAECFVPEIQITDINILKPTVTTNDWGELVTEVEWNFKVDPQGGEKYFRTGGYIYSYELYEMDGELYPAAGYYNEMGIVKGTPYVLDRTGSIYSFTAQEGFSHYYTDPYTGLPVNNRNDSIFIYIIQSDFDYYKFHTSVENYFYYDDGFPFAESVRIYSNVKNALGTFGGYNRQTFYVRK